MRWAVVCVALLAFLSASSACEVSLNVTLAAKLAQYALECTEQEYPTIIHHNMASDADAGVPRNLTPAFFGCYDWHSAVHNHWLLARLVRFFPSEPFAADARSLLNFHLSFDRINTEVAYISADGRGGFERPYGLVWVLVLADEVSALAALGDPNAATWRDALAPLTSLASSRMAAWAPSLPYAVRAGEHSQSGFAFSLAAQYASRNGDTVLLAALSDATFALYGDDADCPITRFEPSGQDFLSPCLGAADAMRRAAASPAAFADWLSVALPSIPTSGDGASWLAPVGSPDPTDGKLAHLNGLNLSRAWMLQAIAAALPENDPRVSVLLSVAQAHLDRGVRSVEGEMTYMESHWLPSFAVYALTCKALEKVVIK